MTEIISRKEAKAKGLTRYFTGKPCPKGHIDYRTVQDCSCMQCCRDKAARQREANPEKILDYVQNRKAKYATNEEVRAKAVARSAEWVSKNKERSAEYRRNRYQENKQEYLAKCKARYHENRLNPEWIERERARQREKNLKNPQHKLSAARTRRARLRGAEGKHNAKDIELILERQQYKCVYCGICLRSRYDVDHIVAISRGGTNWPSNLQCLCPDCNGRKWCKTHEDFLLEIEGNKKERH